MEGCGRGRRGGWIRAGQRGEVRRERATGEFVPGAVGKSDVSVRRGSSCRAAWEVRRERATSEFVPRAAPNEFGASGCKTH